MQYCNTLVAWEAHSAQNEYGDFSYSTAINIKARKQSKSNIVASSEGKELLSKHVFYVAPKEAALIGEMDKLDGELIIEKYEMNSLRGLPVLVRFTTV